MRFTCHLRVSCEFRCELEDIEDVFVGLVAEVTVKVQLKRDNLQDEVFVVEQILNGLVLDKVELDAEEVTVA